MAAKLLALVNPLNRLILVARTHEKAVLAKEQVASMLPEKSSNYLEHIIPLECDHCSLDSVKKFVEELTQKLRESYRTEKWNYSGIDALCLNAAVLVSEGSPAQFTEDGLETTFQTNHLSPFLIANLTSHLINPRGRIVFTTSGLHIGAKLSFDAMLDPVTGDARKGFEMMDGSDFHYKRSYAVAKLCNVAMCAELNLRLRRKDVVVTCFSPGLMLDSGIFRNQKDPIHSFSSTSKESILKKAKTVEWGAGALVFMAIADGPGGQGGVYWSDESFAGCSAKYGKQFCSHPISDTTIDESKRKLLWILSCQMAGIPYDMVPAY